jgi:hypothetical protein
VDNVTRAVAPSESTHLVPQPGGPAAARPRLAELEAQVAAREAALVAFKLELQELQARYLGQMGELYRELSALEAEVARAEIRAGIRPPLDPDAPDEDAEPAGAADAASSCSHRSTTPEALKRVFRDLAKAIHPDLATDDAARYRRHSLMAEANRAYAERDEDRLRLIMRVWERSADAAIDGNDGADEARVLRRIAELEARLLRIDAEAADLGASAICRLKTKIDQAAAQGWDLLAEMVLQARREIARAKARLVTLTVPDRMPQGTQNGSAG